MYHELSTAAQTAYAQLLEACQHGDHYRSVASLPGSFARKTVKGSLHWYYQYYEPSGKQRQIYIGPESEAVQKLIEQKNNTGIIKAIGEHAAAAGIFGCAQATRTHFRVIEQLANYGFFRAGGTLIGTHAFLSYGNLLGVAWNAAQLTKDIDFAHAGKSIAIALPTNLEINTHKAIDDLKMGFYPNVGLQGDAGSKYLHPTEAGFSLDFLTPIHRRKNAQFHHPALGVTLQPLKFIDFILQDTRQAAVFVGNSAVLVNVPAPARYAVHKLIVAAERKDNVVKALKDIDQAAALLEVLREHHVWEVEKAWEDLIGRGSGWAQRAYRGLSMFCRRHPEHPFNGLLKRAK